MTDESRDRHGRAAKEMGTASPPEPVDRASFQVALDRLRTREKAYTREGDAIAAARRRLPMVGDVVLGRGLARRGGGSTNW